MKHRIARAAACLCPILGWSACAAEQAVDEREVALAVAGVQPAMEAAALFAITADECEGCATLEDLRAFLAARFEGCGRATAKPAHESPCPGVGGGPVVEVELGGCELGIGDAAWSGAIRIALRDGGARRIEADVPSAPYGMNACIESRATAAGSAIALRANFLGRGGQIVGVEGEELASRGEAGNVEREGRWRMVFTDAAGAAYDVQTEAEGLERDAGEVLPHAGTLETGGESGRITLRFDERSPASGEVELVRESGAETIEVL